MCEVPDSPEPGTNQVVSAPPKTVTMKAVKQKSASKMHHHNLAPPTAAQPVSLVHGTKEQRKAGVPNYTTKATLCRVDPAQALLYQEHLHSSSCLVVTMNLTQVERMSGCHVSNMLISLGMFYIWDYKFAVASLSNCAIQT